MINGEVAINGEAGKNTANRNFIEIKSSNDLVKISRLGIMLKHMLKKSPSL